MIIKPFRALRPCAELAGKIPSLPYDVIDSAEAREIAAGDPYSFLHVIRPEIDLDPSVDPFDDAVYLKGRENLHAMMEQGWLVRDEQPSFYVYRLQMEEHVQTGVVAASALDDYLEDRIKKHELTRPAKVDDRARLNDTLSLNPGPLMLAYRGLPEINALVRGAVSEDPVAQFRGPDGVRHTLWQVSKASTCDKLEVLFGQLRTTYVADGHHRAAAAAKVGGWRREGSPAASPAAPFNFFLTVLFPSDQLHVLDYNRVVTDLNGLSTERFLERVESAGFEVQPDYRPRRPPHRQSYGVYLDGRWYLFTARPEIVASDDIVERLDVSILTRELLVPVLGVGDQRTDPRIDFVGGIRGMRGLEARVQRGDAAVAFALYPTSLDEVMRVADAGEVMPPKSTWFEPKLRSGLIAQFLDGDRL